MKKVNAKSVRGHVSCVCGCIRKPVAVLAGCVCLTGGAVRGDELAYTGTQPQIWSSTVTWINRTSGSADPVAWESGSTAVMPEDLSSCAPQLYTTLDCQGLLIEGNNTYNFTANGTFNLGAGGIVFNQHGGFDTGYYSAAPSYPDSKYTAIQLKANQAWEGKDPSTYASAAVGRPYGWKRSYAFSYMKADPSVTSLTVKGRLATFFYSPLNDLSGVDVRVESPAKLYLPVYSWPGSSDSPYPDRTEGKIKAKSVTFSGDGALSCFGVATPEAERVSGTTPTTVATIDAEALAPVVTLENGADLNVGDVVFALPKLNVTGTGTSQIAGSTITFANAVTEFAVAEGARFECLAKASCSAPQGSLKVTGAGTFALGQDADPSLVSIEVSSGASFAVTAAGTYLTRLTGSGKLVVSLASGEEAFLANLTGFTGNIEVTGGTLRLSEKPAGVVTTSGTGTVVYGAPADYVTDTSVENATLEVGPGETLNIAGSGLKSSSTVLLKGGTLKVLCNSTVAAAVTQSVTSDWRVDAKATFEGLVRVNGGGVENKAMLYGGDILVTGGLRAESEKDSVWLWSGRMLLADTDGYFCGNFGIDRDSTATYWGVSNATYRSRYVATSGSSNLGLYLRSKYANAVFEVAADATLEFRDNRCFYWGDGTQGTYTNTLLITGGNVSFPSWGTTLGCDGWPNVGRAQLDMRAGVFTFKRPYSNAAGNYASNRLLVRWQGGTLKPVFDGTRRLGNTGFFAQANGSPASLDIGCEVCVCGPDCILDLSGVPAGSAVTNALAGANRSTWWGTADGRLSVKGAGTFVLNNFEPSGMSVQLDDKADIVVPQVSQTLQLGELVVNATEASFAAESVTAAPGLSFDTLRIGALGCWQSDAIASLLSGFGTATYSNVAFDDGAMWQMGGSAPSPAVSGTLTFGKNVRYRVEPGSGSFCAATAAGGVVGAPVWEKLSGSKRTFRIDGTSVWADAAGLIMMFR